LIGRYEEVLHIWPQEEGDLANVPIVVEVKAGGEEWGLLHGHGSSGLRNLALQHILLTPSWQSFCSRSMRFKFA